MKLLTSVFRSCRLNINKITPRFFHENVLNDDNTFASEVTIKNVLQKSSVPFKDGYTCFQVTNCLCCQNVSKTERSFDVFINKQTGFFLCKACKITGDWTSFKNFLTKASINKSDLAVLKKNFDRYDKNSVKWIEVEKKSEQLSCMTNESYQKILSEFNLRPCPKPVIEKLNVRISFDKNTLYFPLVFSDCIVGFKTLGRNDEENNFSHVTDSPGLLTFLKPETVSPVAVVVSNISDFLALASLTLMRYDIICLPQGTRHLPQAILPFFESYNKIIVWLEDGYLDTLATIVKKFNEKRCYIVRSTGNQKSASVALDNNEKILKILSNAKLTYHQFVTTFSSLKEDLFAQLLNKDQLNGVPWKKFPQLTKILKGHRRGELTILTGPTGVGKTTFLSEYSLDLAMQGVHTLWGSFEIKNLRLARIMLTQFAGGPLPETACDYNFLCNKFEQVPIFFLTFHGQQNLEEVMDALHHCSYTYDIAHVLIDNVQFMMNVSPDFAQNDRFWRQDYMIQMFRGFASKYNCHVTLVMHPRKTEGTDLVVNSIFGGVKASQEADNIIIIQNRPMVNSKQKFLEVAKNRYSGDLGSFPLTFDKASLSFCQKSYKNHGMDTFRNHQHQNYNYKSYENSDVVDRSDDFEAEPSQFKYFYS